MTAEELIKGLSANEKRYLRRWQCAWCDHPADSAGCSAIYEKCSEQTRLLRLKQCLADYKPRAATAIGNRRA